MRLTFVAVAGLCLVVLAAPTNGASLSRARALGASGSYPAALAEVEAVLAARPRDVEALLFKGVILTRQGRSEPAIEVFQKLARRQPALPEPHNNLAVLYAALGRYEEARDALLQAIELQPSYDTAHENLGDIYAKLAAVAYERAHELNPGNTLSRRKASVITRVFDSGVAGTGEGALEQAVPEGSMRAALASEPEPASAAVAASAPPSEPEPNESALRDTCYSVTGFRRANELDTVATWLGERGVLAAHEGQARDEIINYKVFLDPLESRAAAEARIDEMRTQGIRDIARIPRGDLENGVALGVYGSEAAARRRVDDLAQRGHAARYSARYRTAPQLWLNVNASDSRAFDRQAFGREFPQFKLDEAPCG